MLVSVAFGLYGPGDPVPLRHVVDLPLPGSTSRWDYASLDAESGRLFLAHLGDDSVVAVDVRSLRILGETRGVASVRGVLVVPSLHRVYAAAQGSRELVVIDERTLRILYRTAAGDVDGLAFDSRTQRVFVSDEGGSADLVFDKDGTLLKRIAIGGHAGNTQYDASSGHMFVAEQTHNALVEMDPERLSVIAKHSLPGCWNAHGLIIETGSRAAFIACQFNSVVMRYDLRKGRLTDWAIVPVWPDVLALDASSHPFVCRFGNGNCGRF